MLERLIKKNLHEAIKLMPAVALLGPRQVGKTTLARLIAKQRPAVYLDLENSDDLALLSSPKEFLRQHGDKLIIFDEIQHAPEIFRVLRGVIDDKRFAGKNGEQFLLLGSASMALLRQTSESLAGRIGYVHMGGLNVLEVGQQNTQTLWLRGGFPVSYMAATDRDCMLQLDDLILTYLERDIPQLGFTVTAVKLRTLWTMLAHFHGETINYNKLASALQVTRKTIDFYLEILIQLLLVRTVHPWYANVKQRLVKSPRYYIRDTGILHRLLDVDDHRSLLHHAILGKSWEGFVVENIHSVLPRLATTFYYRTIAGVEIDLVIKLPRAEIWAVEIKHGRVVPQPSRNFGTAGDDVGATRKFIVYGGDDDLIVGDDVRVISLPKFMEQLIAVDA